MFNQLKFLKLWQKEDQTKVQGLLVLRNRVIANNAQYHDYVRLYQDWFPNLTEEQLDEKVIYSAINFWFKDEDAGTGKVWNYFKEI
jgi:hypothetical protein